MLNKNDPRSTTTGEWCRAGSVWGGLTQSGIREGFSEEVALMRNLQDAWKGGSQIRHQGKGLPDRGNGISKGPEA